MSDDVLDNLQSVGHGAVVGAGGITLQKVLLFVTNLVLTHGLGVAVYGVYALGKRVSRVLLLFGPLGTPASIVRLLPKHHDDPARQNRLLGLAYATAIVASLALGAATFLAADAIDAATLDHPLLPTVIRLFAVLVPVDVTVRLLATVFRTRERVEYQLFLTHVARPGARLVGVVAAVAAGAGVTGVAAGVALATVAVAALGGWLSISELDVRPSRGTTRAEAREFYDHAVPNALSNVGKLFRARLDVLLVGFLLTAEATGIYNLSLFLMSILGIPLFAFNQLLPPIASRLYEEGDVATLNELYGAVTRLIVTATLALAMIGFVYRTELLAVFGESYTRGSLVLGIFVVGRVVGNGAGATGWLLRMTDHQWLRMVDSWVLGTLNVALSYYFVLEYGLIGAALGTGGSIAVVNLVRLSQLWYLEGLWPYDLSYCKPLVASAVMAAVLFSLRPALDGVVLLATGTVVGLLVYLGTLSLLGLESRDRQVVGALLARYRGAL